MRDPSRAIWLLYRAELRRVFPRFSRSLISPAVFMVLALVGPEPSMALSIVAVGATLALGMVAEAIQLAADRDSGVLLEMSRLPISGRELALVRLSSAATFAIAGAIIAAVVATVIQLSSASAPLAAILQAQIVLRAIPLVVLGAVVTCAVSARVPMGRAIAVVVIAVVVLSRIPHVDRLMDSQFRVTWLTDAVQYAGPLVAVALVAISIASWTVLVGALQPRRLRSVQSTVPATND